MRVRDILRKKGKAVQTIEPHRTILEAVRSLVQHKIGALVVTGGDGSVQGIISERDILFEAAERCEQIREALIGDVMTKDVIIGLPDDRVDYVMGIMTKNRIRHLPILDDGELVGIVSIGDVVNAHLGQATYENRLLRDYIHGVAH